MELLDGLHKVNARLASLEQSLTEMHRIIASYISELGKTYDAIVAAERKRRRWPWEK